MKTKKTNKFAAVKTNGFASKLENAVYNILLWLKASGEISDIKCQVPIYLTEAKIKCLIDFSYLDKKKTRIYCEAKGAETDRWKIIKKLWRHYGPGDLVIYKGKHTAPILTEIVFLGGPKCKLKTSTCK